MNLSIVASKSLDPDCPSANVSPSSSPVSQATRELDALEAACAGGAPTELARGRRLAATRAAGAADAQASRGARAAPRRAARGVFLESASAAAPRRRRPRRRRRVCLRDARPEARRVEGSRWRSHQQRHVTGRVRRPGGEESQRKPLVERGERDEPSPPPTTTAPPFSAERPRASYARAKHGDGDLRAAAAASARRRRRASLRKRRRERSAPATAAGAFLRTGGRRSRLGRGGGAATSSARAPKARGRDGRV